MELARWRVAWRRRNSRTLDTRHSDTGSSYAIMLTLCAVHKSVFACLCVCSASVMVELSANILLPEELSCTSAFYSTVGLVAIKAHSTRAVMSCWIGRKASCGLDTRVRGKSMVNPEISFHVMQIHLQNTYFGRQRKHPAFPRICCCRLCCCICASSLSCAACVCVCVPLLRSHELACLRFR